MSKLEVAWVADTGPADPAIKGALQVTPLDADGALYVCNAYNAVISCRRRNRNRTLALRHAGDRRRRPANLAGRCVLPRAGCHERMFRTHLRGEPVRLICSPSTRPRVARAQAFGDAGRVRLREGMGDVPAGYHYVSSAPQVVRGKVVIGGAVLDGQFWGEPSGVIRAFDAVTGTVGLGVRSGAPRLPVRSRMVSLIRPARRTAGRQSAPMSRWASCICRPGTRRRISTARSAGLSTKNIEFGDRTRRRDRRIALALPDCASRYLGLRRAVAADARGFANADRSAQGADSADEARRGLRARSDDGRTHQGRRRSEGPSGWRRARREAVADAAFLRWHAFIPPAEASRVGHVGYSRPSITSCADCSSGNRATKAR